MAITITGIEKKGPVIIFSTDDAKNRVYKVDFKEGKIYGISGKPLKSANGILSHLPHSLSYDNPFYYALNAFSNDANKPIEYYAVVESLLSYPELLGYHISHSMIACIVHDHNGKLPKGYVAWCRENNRMFCFDSLDTFVLYKRFETWPQALAETVKKFSDGTGWDMARAANWDKELCASLIRIANNSLKRYEISNLTGTLRDIINKVQTYAYLRPYLDDTKSAKVAYEILDGILHKERNERILANESKIAALNGVVIDDLMIKVPSTMDDFTDEGNQQHNCVGYFYHERIATGQYLIYFVRRARTPDKSYVTCRFDVDSKQTVEYRTRDNVWFDDDKLIKRIDSMIKTLPGM